LGGGVESVERFVERDRGSRRFGRGRKKRELISSGGKLYRGIKWRDEGISLVRVDQKRRRRRRRSLIRG